MARILMIDDQSHVRAATAVALRALGHEVVDAKDGYSALRVFVQADFDLALVDVFMPGMDGVKLIRELRKRAPKLAMIAMSGVQLREGAGSALDILNMAPDLSNIVCLKKPFRPPELAQAIEKAMAVMIFGAAAEATHS